MHIRIAGYGAISGDGRGYRWIWQAPELSGTLLNSCYDLLDCGRFADPQHLRRLQPGVIEGGLLTVESDWCAAYRFLHGGRDGSREKFFLVAAFFPRSDLSLLDLSELFRHPAFKAVQETCPTGTMVEFPDSKFTVGPLINDPSSGLDSLAKSVAGCVSVASNRGFHLRITGDLQNPVAKLEQRDFTSGQQPHPEPAGMLFGVGTIPVETSTSVNTGSTKKTGAKALIVTGVFGLLIGFCIGWWFPRKPTERKSAPETDQIAPASERTLSPDAQRTPQKSTNIHSLPKTPANKPDRLND